MPVYEFKGIDGRSHERYYKVGKCPQWIVVDGRRCRKSFSSISFRVRPERRFQSIQLPKGTPGADGYSPNGKPRYWREASVDNMEARTGMKWDAHDFHDSEKADE